MELMPCWLAVHYYCTWSTMRQRRAKYLRKTLLSWNFERQKISSKMYPSPNHHSLSALFQGKFWQPVWISPRWKENVSGSTVERKVTRLFKALCQLYLQFKWPFAQDRIVPWEKKKLPSVIWTYLPYSLDSFIYSLWWQLRETQKRLYSHWQPLKSRRFLCLHPSGPLLLFLWKNLKEFFQSRKEAKDPRPLNELRTFLQRNQWKTIKGHLALRATLE